MGFGDEILKTTNACRKRAANKWVNWYVDLIDHEKSHFNLKFRAKPGRVKLDPKVVAWAEEQTKHLKPFILLEPNTKNTFVEENKQWPYDRWQRLSEGLVIAGWNVVQCSYKGAKFLLGGATGIQTPTFWHGVAVLAQSHGAVLPDGGLQHAAGAIGKQAVIIWGGFTPPKILDYDVHTNLHEEDPECTGKIKAHPACRACMERITVERVLGACNDCFNVDAGHKDSV